MTREGKYCPQATDSSVVTCQTERGSLIAQTACVSEGRASRCHYIPPWVTGLWLSLGILALLLGGACRRGVPAVDLGPKPPNPRGTMTGIVRGPEGSSPMSGRTVEIVD